MAEIRRWYLYLVSAVTLQALVWALIALLRNLAAVGRPALAFVALQLAIVIVALPLFLVHWLWAQRAASQSDDDRGSFPRRLFLYAMLAAFLAPLVSNLYGLIRAGAFRLFDIRLGVNEWWANAATSAEELRYTLPAVLLLLLFWLFIWSVKRADDRRQSESDAWLVMSQLYIYVFTAAGLVMAALAFGALLQWLLGELLPGGPAFQRTDALLATEISRLLVGFCLWLPFWLAAQRQFSEPDPRGAESLVRKVYLYAVLFVSALAVIVTTALLVADLLDRVMGVPSGEGDLSQALTIIIVAGGLWAYHAAVLRRDAARIAEESRQALVRRLYTYLMAGLGMSALLGGLTAALVLLIERVQMGDFGSDGLEMLDLAVATILAGLPVWLWHWRKAQLAAGADGAGGAEERRSAIRRFYLYLYIFIATMALLGSAVYILSQLLELLLGTRVAAGLLFDVAEATSFILMAVLVWLYHGSVLAADRRRITLDEQARRRPLRVAVIDAGDGALGRAVVSRLATRVPSAIVQPVGFTTGVALPALEVAAQPGAAQAAPAEQPSVTEQPASVAAIAQAEVIVGPWPLTPAGDEGALDPQLADAVAHSPARKLLYPRPLEDWSWVGAEHWQTEKVARELCDGVDRLAMGDAPGSRTTPQWITALVIVIAGILLFVVVTSLLDRLLFSL